MGFSTIAAQQREQAAETLRSFLAFGLIGSITLHIGVLGFSMSNLLDTDGVPKLADEPIELALVEPPTLEIEKPVEEPQEKSFNSSSRDKTPSKVVSAPSSITIAPSSPSVVAQKQPKSFTNVQRKEVIENLKTPTPQQKIVQSPSLKISTQLKPVISPSPIQSVPPALTSKSSTTVNQSSQDAKPNEKLTAQLRGIRDSRENQGIATNKIGLLDKLSEVGNRSIAPSGTGDRAGSGTGTDNGTGAGSGTGTGNGTGTNRVGSSSGTGTGKGTGPGSGTGTGNGTGSGSSTGTGIGRDSTVATGSGNIRTGSRNTDDDSAGSGGGRLACRDCSKPKYPDSARRRGVEGGTKIKVDVDDKGNVTNVRIAGSSGNSDLDEAAIRAARRWKFDTPNGARQGLSAKIDFAIEGSERSRQLRDRQRQKPVTRRRRFSETQNAIRTPATERTTAPANSSPRRAAASTSRRRRVLQPQSVRRLRSTTSSSQTRVRQSLRRQRIQPQPVRRLRSTASSSQTMLRQSVRRSLQPSQQPAPLSQPANSVPSGSE